MNDERKKYNSKERKKYEISKKTEIAKKKRK